MSKSKKGIASDTPWEYEARKTIKDSLGKANWDYENKLVTVIGFTEEDEEEEYELESLEELIDCLSGEAEEVFYAVAPFEEGEAIYEPDIESWVHEELELYESQLKKMGWEN